MRILGIESSADETAAAVVENGSKLLSSVIASSLDLHTAYGGIVPEIAARSHIEAIMPTIDEALKTAKTDWDNIDAIAVTRGPGLGGSLLIGVMTARTLAIAKNKPLYGVNHVEAHVYANFLTDTDLPNYAMPPAPPSFPLLCLIVSGGHTQLVLFKDHFDYRLLGQTGDDAVGEAFDKVAKILGLPYPGGPSVGQAAIDGNITSVKLPIAKMENKYDFSFSGLKTAVLRAAQEMAGKDYTFPSHELVGALTDEQKNNIAASFQHVAVQTLVNKLKLAVDEFQPKSIAIAGGVAASPYLRQQIEKQINQPVLYPDMKLCTDNAAMIAALGYQYTAAKKPPDDPYTLEIDTNLQM